LYATPKVVELAIVAEIAFAVLGAAVDFVFESRLPEPLRGYLSSERESAWSTSDTLLVGLAIPIAIGVIVGWIGLWRLWPPARPIYLCSWVGSLVAITFCGSVVSFALASALWEVSTLAAGVIIGLIYFSELKHAFERKTV
jgi:hypothetical protein